MTSRNVLGTTIGASMALTSLVLAGGLMMLSFAIAKGGDKPMDKAKMTLTTGILSGFFFWHAKDMAYCAAGMKPPLSLPIEASLNMTFLTASALAALIVKLGSDLVDYLGDKVCPVPFSMSKSLSPR